MMNPLSIELDKGEYTEEEMDALGKILLIANDIQQDQKLLAAVTEHMKGQAKKVKNLGDLKRRAAEINTTDTDMENVDA